MHVQNHYDDGSLIKSLKKGDHKAFEVIYLRFWKSLYGSAYARLKDKAASEEIVQHVFTNLWLRKDDLVLKGKLDHYLFSALKYEILNLWRKQAVQKKYASEYLFLWNEGNETVSDQLSFEELYNRMELEVEKLPERCRLVFILSRKQGRKSSEIASELNLSIKTVEAHLTKALKSLRLSLGDFLVLCIPFLY